MSAGTSGLGNSICRLFAQNLFCFYLSDDYNRVVLTTIEDIPDSDYINASYVDVSNIISVTSTRFSRIFVSLSKVANFQKQDKVTGFLEPSARLMRRLVFCRSGTTSSITLIFF